MSDRSPWWKQSGESAVRSVWNHIRGLGQWRAPYLRDVSRLIWLYEREKYGLSGRSNDSATATHPPGQGHQYYYDYDGGEDEAVNLIKSRVDTIGARLFREVPAVEVSRRNATFEQEFRAAEQTEILHGVMNTPASREQLRRPGYDGLLTGTGICFPLVRDGRVKYERVLSKQLWWDPADAQYDPPRALHYWTRKSKSVVVAEIAEDSTISSGDKSAMIVRINALPEVTLDNHAMQLNAYGFLTPYERRLQATTATATRYAVDQVHVIYSWHLPGSATATDGRYLISVHGGSGAQADVGHATGVIRYDGAWKRTSYPIIYWSPYLCYEGLEGIGIGHHYYPYQRKVDRVFGKLDEELETLGHAKVLVNQAGREQLEAIADPDIDVIQMDVNAPPGTKPYEIITARPQSDQDLSWFDKLIEVADKLGGISETLAAGGSTRSPGASGVAMFEEDERQGDRFADVEGRWDGFLLRAAKQTIYALNDAVARDKKFRVTFFDQAVGSRQARWAAVQVADEDFSTQMEPVGLKGRTKWGRMARLRELQNMGAVSAEDANAEMTRSADVERLTRRENAGRMLVEYQLSNLSCDNHSAEEYAEYMPTRETPLGLADRMGLQQLQIAMRRGALQETQNRLRDYRAKAQALIAKERQEMAAAAAIPEPALGTPELDASAAAPALPSQLTSV